MKTENEKLFRNYLVELKSELDSAGEKYKNNFDETKFQFLMDKIVLEKYSEIYFYIRQFNKDMDNALMASIEMLTVKDMFFVSPSEIIAEMLENPIYLKGRLCPLKSIIICHEIKDLTERYEIGEKIVLASLNEDDELRETFFKKVEIEYSRALNKFLDEISYFPIVEEETKILNESGVFH